MEARFSYRCSCSRPAGTSGGDGDNEAVSYRTTAAMLAVLIILAGAVYYITRTPAPDTTGSAVKTQPVLTFTAADATKLVLTASDKTTELTKNGSNWTIAQPIQGPAET